MPFLSVIIPTFNSGGTLPGTLDSLASQTFRDFEVIVVDGLSTDNTKEIFDGFKEKLASAVWISEKDQGIYDAMNKGIKRSSGEWIYFLGGDDALYNDGVFEEVHKAAVNSEASVIYGDVVSKAFRGRYAGVFTIQKIYEQNISHQAIFMRKSVFDVVGFFSLKYKILADWEHNLRWFLSDRLSHTHIDLIIANYGHDGVSSKNIDDVFFRDRDWNYVNRGRRRLGTMQKLKFVLKEYRACLAEGDVTRLLKRMAATPLLILGI